MTRTKQNEEGKAAAAEVRALLAARSAEVADLVEAGEYESTNEAVIQVFYERDGRRDFRGFWDWKAAGKRVRKGEKGWPVWARPLREEDSQEQPTPATTPDVEPAAVKLSQDATGKARMWPMAYLFHAGQVEDDPRAGAFKPRYAVRHG